MFVLKIVSQLFPDLIVFLHTVNDVTTNMDKVNDTDHMKFFILNDRTVYADSNNWIYSAPHHNEETPLKTVKTDFDYT